MSGKLLEGQLRKVRKAWEIDDRKGFSWLCKEMNLPVSRQYLGRIAREQGWKKATLVAPFSGNQVSNEETGKEETKSATKRATKNSADADNQGKLTELQAREDIFVKEYTATFNASKTALAMGVTVGTVRKMLKRQSVQEKIAERMRPRAAKLGVDADSLMEMWAKILTFDTNEIMQHRRQCCRFCYSTDGSPMISMDEYYEEKKKYDRRRLYKPDMPEYPPYEGEWWDRSLPPKDDCPNCHGEGEPYVWIADTRYLSPFAKYMYSGIKMVKGEIEVIMLNKEKAAENLAKALGLFREKPEEAAGNSVTNEELLKMFEERMRQSAERNRKMCEERGLEIVDVEVAADGE